MSLFFVCYNKVLFILFFSILLVLYEFFLILANRIPIRHETDPDPGGRNERDPKGNTRTVLF